MLRHAPRPLLLPLLLPLALLTSCGPEPRPGTPPTPTVVRTITLAAYTTPREVYGKALIPSFQKEWKARTGEEVQFQESYLGSGAQVRNILGGFEADVAALSLERDVRALQEAGLVTHDWRTGPGAGMVTRSIVVFAVRKGNPRKVAAWDDLTADDLEILTPDLHTSGGAIWNVCAPWGAALRGQTRQPATEAGAEALLAGLFRRVRVMDKGARESMINFENGLGDVALTYENEVLASRTAGRAIDYVVPPATLLVENPLTLVDRNVDQHDNRAVVEAFVQWLTSTQAQREYARFGFRPVDAQVEKEFHSKFPEVPHLFTIQDLGGWETVERVILADDGAYARIMAERQPPPPVAPGGPQDGAGRR